MLVDTEENDTGDDGDDGVSKLVIGGEISVRWHSLRRVGIEDAGRIAGSEKAWM